MSQFKDLICFLCSTLNRIWVYEICKRFAICLVFTNEIDLIEYVCVGRKGRRGNLNELYNVVFGCSLCHFLTAKKEMS